MLARACRSAAAQHQHQLASSLRPLSSAAAALKGARPPHGGVLKDSMVEDEAAKQKLIQSANHLIEMNERQSCDTEVLMVGGFSPIDGFMNQDTYKHVVEHMRLPSSNLLFGLPVVFDTARDDIKPGEKVLLRWGGTDMAVLEVEDRFTPDKPLECLKCYGTSSIEHPGVRMVAMERKRQYLGGKVTGLNIPKRVFPCATPQQVRAMIPEDADDVVAFQ